jgi:hypothetical protein
MSTNTQMLEVAVGHLEPLLEEVVFVGGATIELWISDPSIRAIPPHFLLATKLEAFRGRGKQDFYESRDFEDIVRLIDGRGQLPEEVAGAPKSVRDYIAEQLKSASERDQFDNGLEGALPAGPDVRERVDEVIWPRVRTLIG